MAVKAQEDSGAPSYSYTARINKVSTAFADQLLDLAGRSLYMVLFEVYCMKKLGLLLCGSVEILPFKVLPTTAKTWAN